MSSAAANTPGKKAVHVKVSWRNLEIDKIEKMGFYSSIVVLSLWFSKIVFALPCKNCVKPCILHLRPICVLTYCRGLGDLQSMRKMMLISFSFYLFH